MSELAETVREAEQARICMAMDHFVAIETGLLCPNFLGFLLPIPGQIKTPNMAQSCSLGSNCSPLVAAGADKCSLS